nr:immunoglobulin heavy chain junction region [Homo sapiens]
PPRTRPCITVRE